MTTSPVMRRQFRLCAGFVVVLLCGIIAATFYGHRGGEAAASAMSAATIFLGYTNDPTGGRLARFSFSNTCTAQIQRHYFYAIDFQTSTGWAAQGTWSFPDKGPSSHSWRAYGPVLRPRAREIVTVAAPLTNCWRISFPFVEPENTALRVGVEAFPGVQEHGFLTNIDNPFRTKYWSESGKIDPIGGSLNGVGAGSGRWRPRKINAIVARVWKWRGWRSIGLCTHSCGLARFVSADCGSHLIKILHSWR